MLSKNEVKYIQSLCHKKQRNETGLFIVEGVKLIEELLTSNLEIQKIYALSSWLQEHQLYQSITTIVESFELEKISSLQSPQAVLAVVKQPFSISELPMDSTGIILCLDGIQDPGNLGTIIRIADWFGIEHIVCSSNTVELYNPKVIQSTMGSFLRATVHYTNLTDYLSNTSLPVYGALLDGENIFEITKPQNAVIVIGSEGKGISSELLPFIQHPITIPKKGGAESLNAAVATGILAAFFC
ncbi:MAG: TrmH family RNA methyltransferase [Chitinophagaceae bacterium]